MGSRDNHAFSMYSGLPTCFTLLFLIVHCFEFSEDFDEAILYQRKNLIRWSRIWYIFVYNLPFYTLLIFDKWQLFFFCIPVRIKDVGAQNSQEWELPQCSQDIVGSTLTFQLNLSHFNLTAKHQSFTVSHI